MTEDLAHDLALMPPGLDVFIRDEEGQILVALDTNVRALVGVPMCTRSIVVGHSGAVDIATEALRRPEDGGWIASASEAPRQCAKLEPLATALRSPAARHTDESSWSGRALHSQRRRSS